jgi:predicted HAD superfamily hydrolase
LVARHCYFPDAIFDLVAEEAKFPTFTFFRKAAYFKSDRTYPGIYKSLQETLSLSIDETARLMQLEWEVELSQVFAIRENLSLISDGDLIVSDTYYNVDQLKIILDQVGLEKKVQIYATPIGKASGVIWDDLIQKYQILSHLGDAILGDVEQPKKRGIDAVLYTGSTFSEEEAILPFSLACKARANRLL